MQAVFVCDVHIPPRLVAHLKTKGHEAFHAFERGFGAADDSVLADYAIALNAIIIPKDRDFLQIAIERLDARVILVCLGNCANRVLIENLDDQLDAILSYFDGHRGVVELR